MIDPCDRFLLFTDTSCIHSVDSDAGNYFEPEGDEDDPGLWMQVKGDLSCAPTRSEHTPLPQVDTRL